MSVRILDNPSLYDNRIDRALGMGKDAEGETCAQNPNEGLGCGAYHTDLALTLENYHPIAPTETKPNWIDVTSRSKSPHWLFERESHVYKSQPSILNLPSVTGPATHTLLRYVGGLAAACYVLLQARKPDKWFGRIFARAMNKGHENMTDWGLSHVRVENQFKILDVGCGGGRTIEKLGAIAAGGMVYGIDYAEGSVAVSREHNAELIEAGRVVIKKASVSQLPFLNDTFDLVTAIETQYYWPDLEGDMREILRVLKPSGRLIVIAEMYKGGKYDWLKWPVMWFLRSSHLSVSDHRELFASTGYVNIEIFEESKRGWICGIAMKPSNGG